MKLTAQVKLVPTPEQAALLKATLEAANAACNAISAYAWNNKLFGKYPFSGIYREASASPASGSASRHKREQLELVKLAVGA